MSKFDRFLEDLRRQEPIEKTGGHGAAGEIRNLPEGRWIERGVYCSEDRFALGEFYGAARLDPQGESGVMRRFGASGPIVFLDLETTGLSGGTGTYAFLCGIGIVEGESFKVLQLFLEGPARERSWLAAIDSVVPPDACLVTYNGKAFDLPLLRTRHILSRSTPVWDKSPHIDLLHHARRIYRGRLESCSLGSMERHILHIAREGCDIPGWQIPALYAEYLRTHDASKLQGVFYHNRQDILSLAILYCYIARVLEGDTQNGLDLVKAGDFWESLGEQARAAAFWDRACEYPESEIEARSRQALYAKRELDFVRAHREFLLALNAAKGRTETGGASSLLYTLLEETAKLEEHRLGMPETALTHAEEAMRWLFAHRYLLGRSFSSMHRSMQNRIERLRRKVEKRSPDR